MTHHNPISPLDQPIRGTNHIYGSGQPSAIKRTKADSRLKDKNKLVPNITPRAVDPRASAGDPGMLQSTDKYYANQEDKVPTPHSFNMQQAEQQALRQGGSFVGQATHNQSVRLIEIRSEKEIVARMREAVDALQGGVGKIRVLLWNRDWVAAARQQIEFAVTRERISEDRGRDVEFGVHRDALENQNRPQNSSATVNQPPEQLLAQQPEAPDNDTQDVDELLSSLPVVAEESATAADGTDDEAPAEDADDTDDTDDTDDSDDSDDV
jgi:hypothetical protein